MNVRRVRVNEVDVHRSACSAFSAVKPSFAVLVCLSACAGQPSTEDQEARRAAESQVIERLFSYPSVVKAGQLDSVMAYWAPDVRIFEKDVRVEGDAALRKIGSDFFPAYEVTRLAYAPAETVAHDDGAVVYQFGYYTEDVRPKGKTAVTNTRNNYAARWIKDSAGNWRFHRFIAMPSPKEPAPTATVAAVAPAATAQPGDAASVEQRMTEYVNAIRSNDPAAVMGIWADDGRFVEADVELNDKPALSKFMSDAFAEYRIAALDLASAEVFVHDGGTVAYQLGSYTERMVPKVGRGAPMTYRNHFLARWKKSGAGDWLLDRFFATPMPPVRN